MSFFTLLTEWLRSVLMMLCSFMDISAKMGLCVSLYFLSDKPVMLSLLSQVNLNVLNQMEQWGSTNALMPFD